MTDQNNKETERRNDMNQVTGQLSQTSVVIRANWSLTTTPETASDNSTFR